MVNKRFLFVFGLFYQFCIGQTVITTPLHGQVVSDSLQIDNGYVINLNSKIRTIIKPAGFFDIPAREKDTLVFLGMEFQSKKIVLTRVDFSVALLKIKLKATVNKLDEVILNKNNTPQPKISNSQKYVDKKYFDDKKSSLKDDSYPPSGGFEKDNMTDFVRLFKDIRKRLQKKKTDTDNLIDKFTFIELVLNNFSPSFFTDSLHLKEDEVILFLVFCENDPKSNVFLKKYNQFEMMDFLITKNEEFKKLTVFEK